VKTSWGDQNYKNGLKQPKLRYKIAL
jgi:hypothetical protein